MKYLTLLLLALCLTGCPSDEYNDSVVVEKNRPLYRITITKGGGTENMSVDAETYRSYKIGDKWLPTKDEEK